MKVTIEDGSAARIVRVHGEVDLDTSPRLKDELQRALKGVKAIQVELREVQYIDSSGVAVLIQALKRAGRLGARLSLLDPSPRVLAVLELAQLQQLFTIERSG